MTPLLSLGFGAIFKVLGWASGLFNSAQATALAKQQIKAQVQIESYKNELEFAKLRKEMLVMYQGWWVTRWIVPCIAYPLIVWWICVIADSVYQFPEWDVARLPDPMMEWAGAIILSFFLVRVAEIVFNPARGPLAQFVADRLNNLFKR